MTCPQCNSEETFMRDKNYAECKKCGFIWAVRQFIRGNLTKIGGKKLNVKNNN